MTIFTSSITIQIIMSFNKMTLITAWELNRSSTTTFMKMGYS